MKSLTQQNASWANRRRIIQAVAATAGAVLLAGASPQERLRSLAQHDDFSGSGHGRGRGRGGHDEEDEEEAVALTGAVAPGSLEIRIVSDDAGGFVPGELTVDLGQAVTFVNAHSDEHTATSSGFDTGIIPEGGLVTVVLDTPGAFAYACRIHPEMTGRIAVRGADGVVPQPAPATPSAGGAVVEIANLAFAPASITVPPGSTVTWNNADAVPHTVTSLTGEFDSGIFDPGASFSTTFPTAGDFTYQCLLHPTMQGTVIVTGEAAALGARQPAVDGAPPVASTPASLLLVDLVPDSGGALPPLRALLGLHADGLVHADFAAIGAAPTSPIPLEGQGTWRMSADQLTLNLVTLVRDEGGRLHGMLNIVAEGQRDASGSLRDGVWTATLQDSLGVETESSTGTWSGETVDEGDGVMG